MHPNVLTLRLGYAPIGMNFSNIYTHLVQNNDFITILKIRINEQKKQEKQMVLTIFKLTT